MSNFIVAVIRVAHPSGLITIHSVWLSRESADRYAAKLRAAHSGLHYLVENETVKRIERPAAFSRLRRVRINGTWFELQDDEEAQLSD